MARKFFITGGTGLIGRALVRALLEQREQLDIEQLMLLTRNPERFRAAAPDIADAAAVRLMQGDMAGDVWPDEEFTDIIHGATDVNDMLVADRFAYAWSIVEGTRRTLELAKRSGCKRYLYLSSGAVYGPGPYPEAGIPENWSIGPDLQLPATAYGQAKRFSEHLCSLFSKQQEISLRIARIFSVIGEESPLDGQYALGNFLLQATRIEFDCIRINGDGTASRSYLHVDDLAEWLIRLHESSASLSIVNVGSNKELSIASLAHLISGLSSAKKSVVIEGKLLDYAGRSRYFPDTTSIRALLNVREGKMLETTLAFLLRKIEQSMRDV